MTMTMPRRPSAPAALSGTAPTALPGTAPAALSRPLRVRHAWQVTLASQLAAVPRGRHAVLRTLLAWKLEVLADTAALLVTELIANAVEAAGTAAREPAGGRVVVTVRHTGRGVLVEVWDPNPATADRRDAGLTDESGRGLLLVDSLASAWGQYRAGPGKVVWCEITCPGAGPPGSL